MMCMETAPQQNETSLRDCICEGGGIVPHMSGAGASNKLAEYFDFAVVLALLNID